MYLFFGFFFTVVMFVYCCAFYNKFSTVNIGMEIISISFADKKKNISIPMFTVLNEIEIISHIVFSEINYSGCL